MSWSGWSATSGRGCSSASAWPLPAASPGRTGRCRAGTDRARAGWVGRQSSLALPFFVGGWAVGRAAPSPPRFIMPNRPLTPSAGRDPPLKGESRRRQETGDGASQASPGRPARDDQPRPTSPGRSAQADQPGTISPGRPPSARPRRPWSSWVIQDDRLVHLEQGVGGQPLRDRVQRAGDGRGGRLLGRPAGSRSVPRSELGSASATSLSVTICGVVVKHVGRLDLPVLERGQGERARTRRAGRRT